MWGGGYYDHGPQQMVAGVGSVFMNQLKGLGGRRRHRDTNENEANRNREWILSH